MNITDIIECEHEFIELKKDELMYYYENWSDHPSPLQICKICGFIRKKSVWIVIPKNYQPINNRFKIFTEKDKAMEYKRIFGADWVIEELMG